MSKLDGKIEEIIEMIIEGKSYRLIAEKLKCPLSTLHDFTSKTEHSARVRAALDYSASTFDDKAEEVLINAEGTKEEIMRARELAQHYRWKASKRSPKKYGDKLELSGDSENPVSRISLTDEQVKDIATKLKDAF